MAATSPIKKVAIIGSGSIGCSWAALFLANGIETTVFDVNPAAESLLRSLVAGALPVLARLGTTTNQNASASDILFTTDLARALQGADFVQENGPERLDLKRQLFNDITKHIGPEVIISTSSSGLTCSSVQSGVVSHPERCVVGHPFNPPHLIPLVEVVGGSQTTPAVIERTMRFYESLGKKAVHVKKEVPGHIANRLQGALFREVMHLIQNDVCTVSDIEDAMQNGPGLRWGVMGPSCLMHLAGGPGGIEHMSNHLLEPMMGWYAKEDPVVNDDLKKRWIDGTRAAVDGRSYENLAKQRDEELIELLKIRKEWDGYAGSQKSA